ncbi:MAG TPA: GAF domain-containing protein [bacterium]|nr:GAF domain-containing protein [bacterium]
MKKKTTFFISVLILGVVALSDFHRIRTGIIAFPPLLREVLLTAVLLLQVIRVSWRRPVVRSDLIAQLQGLGISMLLLWVLNYVLSGQIEFEPDSFGTLTLNDLIIWTAFGMLLILFLIRILQHLSALIFIQQGRHTERNLRLFFISVFLAMGYNLFKSDPWEIDVFEGTFHFGRSPWENGMFGVVFLFSFILGFRNKWIHYLKKHQKWRVLFFGGLVFVFSQTYVHLIPETIQPYSNLLRVFSSCVFLLWTAYGGMALAGILFHLPAAGLIDRRAREIGTLQGLSTTISSIFRTDELIEKTVSMACQIVGADSAWIELREDDVYRIAGTRGIRTHELTGMPPPGLSPLRESVTDQQETVLINHLGRDKRTAHLRKWRSRAGSLLAAPLIFKEKVFGVLYAFCDRNFCFVEDGKGMFRAFANQVAIALENANLVAFSIEQERYREELRLAHEAQMRLLPRSMPHIPGAELEGLCVTANDIGGDFYDFIPVGPERIDLLVGDVSGKGASAAFYMAEIKGVVQTLAHLFSTPGEILKEINTFVRRHFEPDMFVTMIYAVYCPGKRRLRFARAGHTPVIHLGERGVESLEPRGLGLGLAEGDAFSRGLEEVEIGLRVREKLVFFTDGLIEVRNPEGEEFGENRLYAAMNEVNGFTAAETVASLHGCVDRFRRHHPVHDDMTLVILNVTA